MRLFYDLGIAWEWEYDYDFVNLIGQKCKEKNLSFCYITSKNLNDFYTGVKEGNVKFLAYFDRASDTNDNFLELNFLLQSLGTRVINRYQDMLRASDKANMHFELLNLGVEVPYTIVIPPFELNPTLELDVKVLERIGIPFIVKPSTETGGGIGVQIVCSFEDIIRARRKIPYDKYLIQEMIHPAYINGRKAWFRAFYVFGDVLTCWWDNEHKVYEVIKDEEIEMLKVVEIESVMKKIYQACRLDFFSSEIVLTSRNGESKYVSVDYVNEVCDMRLKSKAADGVPDEVVEKIAEKFAEFVGSLK